MPVDPFCPECCETLQRVDDIACGCMECPTCHAAWGPLDFDAGVVDWPDDLIDREREWFEWCWSSEDELFQLDLRRKGKQ